MKKTSLLSKLGLLPKNENSKEFNHFKEFKEKNTLVVGSTGIGKTLSVCYPTIQKFTAEGYAGVIYDLESECANVAYSSFLKAKKENPNLKLDFAQINFTDLDRTIRVNVLSDKYYNSDTDYMYIRMLIDTLTKNLDPRWKDREDFSLFLKATEFINMIACLCYKQRDRGINTLPHVIAICLSETKDILRWIEKDQEINDLIDIEYDVMDKAKELLSRLDHKELFWVLSPQVDEEFSLDVTNKEKPVLLCIGNAPQKTSNTAGWEKKSLNKDVALPAISCIFNILMGQMNQAGKANSFLCIDEFSSVAATIDVTNSDANLSRIVTLQSKTQLSNTGRQDLLKYFDVELFGRDLMQVKTSELKAGEFIFSKKNQKEETIITLNSYNTDEIEKLPIVAQVTHKEIEKNYIRVKHEIKEILSC